MSRVFLCINIILFCFRNLFGDEITEAGSKTITQEQYKERLIQEVSSFKIVSIIYN